MTISTSLWVFFGMMFYVLCAIGIYDQLSRIDYEPNWPLSMFPSLVKVTIALMAVAWAIVMPVFFAVAGVQALFPQGEDDDD